MKVEQSRDDLATVNRTKVLHKVINASFDLNNFYAYMQTF